MIINVYKYEKYWCLWCSQRWYKSNQHGQGQCQVLFKATSMIGRKIMRNKRLLTKGQLINRKIKRIAKSPSYFGSKFKHPCFWIIKFVSCLVTFLCPPYNMFTLYTCLLVSLCGLEKSCAHCCKPPSGDFK